MYKKLIILSSLAAASVAASIAATSGSIEIKGIVPAILEIIVTPQPGYDSLNIAGGATRFVVAKVTEKSNSSTGYTVELKSKNDVDSTSINGAFLKGLNSTDTVLYTMEYGGNAVNLTDGIAKVTDSPLKTAGTDKDLSVTFSGAFLSADTYSDTLTLTIAAK